MKLKANPAPISTTFACALAGTALLILALLHPAVAGADGRIGEPGFSAGGVEAPRGLAVSKKEAGDIYVVNAGRSQRVDEFEPDGTFLRAFGWGVVPGAAAGTGTLTAGSAAITGVTTVSGEFEIGQILTTAGAGLPVDDRITRVEPSEIILSKPAVATEPAVAITVAAGPGNVSTNEQQKLTVTATGGEFKLTFTSPKPSPLPATTAGIPAGAGAGAVQSALEALASIGAGNVAVSGGPGDSTGTHPYLITFQGRYADSNVSQLSAANVSLSGGSPSSTVAVITTREGAGALETCTTVCWGENVGQDGEQGAGARAGQLRWADGIAIDNSCAQQEPPLTGAACEGFDPSYGDVYVLDARNYRIQKFKLNPVTEEYEFALMFGGDVDKTTGADVCTAADLAGGDTCGIGVPGTGAGHFYNASPLSSWENENASSIAVGPTGTVYVGDYGRVQEFEPDGAFAGELKPPDIEPRFVSALAVDAAGDIYESSATYGFLGFPLLSQVPGIRKYGPSHALIETLDSGAGSEPTKIALDESGDLLVSDFNGGDFQFRAYNPAGALYSFFASDQVEALNTEAPHGIAVGDAVAKLYATSYQPGGEHIAVIPLPEPGPPVVRAGSEQAAPIQPITATLHATVNPQGFETAYHFQYIAKAAYQANLTAGHEGFLGAETTAVAHLEPLIHDDPVSGTASGLHPETAYLYRALAANECNGPFPEPKCEASGEPAEFTTLPPVSVGDFTTQTVGPELVTLKAELNPNGSVAAAHYTIKVGKDTNYSQGSSEGTLPATGNSFEKREATFAGLQPNTTYHYQLTAHNEYGEVKVPDAAFTTEPTIAEEDGAQNCENSQLRSEDASLALPDCRAYELVSPPLKGGFPTGNESWLAPGGERVYFQSGGVFAGAAVGEASFNPYVAHRTASGWLTEYAVGRPAGPAYQPRPFPSGQFDAALETSLFQVGPGLTQAEADEAGSSNAYYLRHADGTFAKATPTIGILSGAKANLFDEVVAESSDLSNDFLRASYRLLAEDPRPDSLENHYDRIYQVSGAGGPSPAMRLVAEIPLGITAPQCEIDSSFGHLVNSSSADGSVLFYDAPLEVEPGGHCDHSSEGGPNKSALFACDLEAGPCAGPGAHAPLQLSAPPPSQCHSPSPCATGAPVNARFYGASPAGSLAWFTTEQPLVDADADAAESAASNDLYLARLENGQLTGLIQASHGEASDPTPGRAAGVKGVVSISADGNRAYFVATGLLTDEANQAGELAAQGADNLYAYDATGGETKFLARLCSGPGQSGTAADPACPPDLNTTVGSRRDSSSGGSRNDSSLWFSEGGNSAREARSTPDGRYLLFTSYARLASADTDGAADVYRYDFQSGQLTRISIGRDGNDDDGNDDAYDAEIASEPQDPWKLQNAAEDRTRSISADGSLVVFQTAAPLVSYDTKTGASPGCGINAETGCDVYQWQQDGHGGCQEPAGCLSLVSTGLDQFGSRGGVISASGRDVSFVTSRSILPVDTDGLRDVYDAREAGGFPRSAEAAICRSGETCHRSFPPEPTPPNVTTEHNESGGNGPIELECGRGRHRVKKHGEFRCVPNKRHTKKHHHKDKRASHHGGGAK